MYNKDMINIWSNLKKPIYVLSPMAGYTDSAFRFLCREFGADLVLTELVSADAIAHGNFLVEKSTIKIGEESFDYTKVSSKKNNTTPAMLSFLEGERPIIVQLFGKNPENFAKAAKWISEELKPDGIDINMGCPARKVVGSDHGSALLKNPDLAVEIVKAVTENTSLPVSVKTRLGWDNDDQILEFGPKLIDAGIQALIVHGRTYQDKFKNHARWENIIKLKQLVGDRAIVIGNGDIKHILDVEKSDPERVLDGYAIGRASFGNPWIFSRKDIKPEDIPGAIIRHANLVEAISGEHGIIEFRKHLLAYLKGFEGAKDTRIHAVKIETAQDVRHIVEKVKNKIILNHTCY